jgi:hypothetical protein
MFKKFILFSAVSISLGMMGSVNAQEVTSGTFSIAADTVFSTTAGTSETPSNNPPVDCVELKGTLINEGTEPIFFGWKLLFPQEIPTGWVITGFCDNITCWAPNGSWEQGVEKVSGEVAPGGSAPLWLHLAAPSSTANGTGIVSFQVRTTEQTDTVTFVLTKDATGINLINAKDARVNIYPNPATNHINVFADQSLNAKSIAVFNILGRQLSTKDIKPNTLTTMIDVSSLASGMYMVRIMDENGKVITSRKFNKQ